MFLKLYTHVIFKRQYTVIWHSAWSLESQENILSDWDDDEMF